MELINSQLTCTKVGRGMHGLRRGVRLLGPFDLHGATESRRGAISARIVRSLTVIALVTQSSMLLAANGIRTAPVDSVETESSASQGIENLMYVQQSTAWTGSPNCPATLAYFNAKDNPHFAAIVLAARVSDRPLRVFVDDTLPKINGFCRIINLQL